MAEEGWRAWQHEDAPLRIGISTCLLGEEVRWDGGHKRSRFLTDVLSRYVEWVPVCPELEIGLGVPREPIRLEGTLDADRLVGTRSGDDHGRAMDRYTARKVRELAADELCGYVLKRGSPSCGMERVPVWPEKGPPDRRGVGRFARVLLEREPRMPVEEEGRLNDPRLRENWIERVFAYRRLRTLFAGRWKVGELVAFHASHKLQLLAHSPDRYRTLGRLVAEAKALPRAELRDRYADGFMEALARKATPGRHVNVLQHMIGYFRKRLDQADMAELHDHVEDYRAGHAPLLVPLTLIRHHARRLEIGYLLQQLYLDPHPKELLLRNHV